MYYFIHNYRANISEERWKYKLLCVSGTFEEGIHYVLEQGYREGVGSQLYAWCESYVKTRKHLEVTERLRDSPFSEGFSIIVNSVESYIDFGVVESVNYSKL